MLAPFRIFEGDVIDSGMVRFLPALLSSSFAHLDATQTVRITVGDCAKLPANQSGEGAIT